MTDTKISGLPSLTGANVATDDKLVIVDTSATATKEIDASEARHFMNPFRPIHPPSSALFTYSANGTSATQTVNDGSLCFTMTATDSGAASVDRVRFRGKAVPAGASWTVGAIIRPANLERGNRIRSGIALHESATGKTQWFGLDTAASTPAFGVQNAANLNTWTAASVGFLVYTLEEFWARIVYDGTNYSYQWSPDFGGSWITLVTESKTTRFTTAADKVGLAIETFGTFTAGRTVLGCPYWNDPDFASTYGP